MRDLPDDNNWIPETRRAIGNRACAERERQNLTQELVILAVRMDRVTSGAQKPARNRSSAHSSVSPRSSTSRSLTL